jgi:hypothetical protein
VKGTEMKRKVIVIATLLIVIMLTSACVPMDGTYTEDNPAGFWWGLWHGMIWFITFFMGVFTGGRYTIYEAFNTGWGYNLGFLIGIGVIFGGSSATVRRESD